MNTEQRGFKCVGMCQINEKHLRGSTDLVGENERPYLEMTAVIEWGRKMNN